MISRGAMPLHAPRGYGLRTQHEDHIMRIMEQRWGARCVESQNFAIGTVSQKDNLQCAREGRREGENKGSGIRIKEARFYVYLMPSFVVI